MATPAGHGSEKYATGTRLLSSDAQNWSDVLVETWCHRKGELPAIEPRDLEVVVLLAGQLRVRRRGDDRVQDTLAVPGTVWICPAGIREDMIRLYDDIQETVHIYLPAAPFTHTALAEFDLDLKQVRLRYDGGFHERAIEQIARTILAELKDPGPAGNLLVETMSMALSAYLLRHHSNLAATALPDRPVKGALETRKLQRVLDYVATNLDRDMTLEELAAQSCLSRYHFARAFKQAVGMSPHQYVVKQRLERAKALLSSRRLPLTEVAALSGFTSQAHFTRTFKKETGLTPGAFRNR